jgi:hypothetical protein
VGWKQALMAQTFSLHGRGVCVQCVDAQSQGVQKCVVKRRGSAAQCGNKVGVRFVLRFIAAAQLLELKWRRHGTEANHLSSLSCFCASLDSDTLSSLLASACADS